MWTTNNTLNADLYGPEDQVVTIRKVIRGFAQFTSSSSEDDDWQLTESDTVVVPQETVISNENH